MDKKRTPKNISLVKSYEPDNDKMKRAIVLLLEDRMKQNNKNA